MKKLIMFVVFGLLITNVSFACITTSNTNDCPVKDPIVVVIDDTDPTPDPEPEPEPVVEVKKKSRSGSYLPAVWARMQAERLLASQPAPVYVWDVVKFGDKGEDVKTLQMYLNNKGASLVVDGIYGPLTLAAFGSFK